MTLFTEIYPEQVRLVGRTWFKSPGAFQITAPSGARVIRAHAIGAGGYTTSLSVGNYGGGAAFARSTRTCVPTEIFNVQVGDVNYTDGNGTSPGDSWVKRAADSTIIVLADRGRGGNGNTFKGYAVNSVGDVRRDGNPGSYSLGGASGTDVDDPFSLGLGGRGTTSGVNYAGYAPLYGGGGTAVQSLYSGSTGYTYPCYAGGAVVVVEFFDADPGYGQ